MKQLFATIAILALTMVSCDTSTTPTEPISNAAPMEKATQVKDVPIGATFYNECCDEFVEVEGTAHFVFRDNGIHIGVKDITGTGQSSGYTYTNRGTSTQNVSENDGNGAANFTITVILNMQNDDGCSFKYKVTVHFTENANGDLTATVIKVSTQCD